MIAVFAFAFIWECKMNEDRKYIIYIMISKRKATRRYEVVGTFAWDWIYKMKKIKATIIIDRIIIRHRLFSTFDISSANEVLPHSYCISARFNYYYWMYSTPVIINRTMSRTQIDGRGAYLLLFLLHEDPRMNFVFRMVFYVVWFEHWLLARWELILVKFNDFFVYQTK